MAILVQCLGAVLALGGLIGLVYGIDMLPTERGIAGTISSTVALTGGILTAAIGVLIQRVEALRTAAPATQRPAPAKSVAEKPVVDEVRPRVEPQLSEPAAPVVEPAAPKVAMPRLPDLDLSLPVEPEPKRVAPPAAESTAADKPRFKLPSFRIGGGTVAAGAAAAGAAAGAAMSRGADTVSEASDAALAKVNAAVESIASLAKPDPVDPPVEMLTPVEVDRPADDSPAETLVAENIPPLLPTVDAAAHAPVPMPEEAVKPAAEDPFAAFDAELDKLIPLKSGKKGRGRKEPAPGLPAAEALAATPPAPEEVAVAPEAVPAEPIPADVMAEPADLQPPPPAPSPNAEIVGAYESGGAKYTMYSDGSVVAEAEGQTLFFKSLDELRQFVDGAK